MVAQWYLSAPWPEEWPFNRAISQANGLFIFIKAVVLALEHCKDPTESLKATSQASGLNSLYKLHPNLLKAQIAPGDAEFRRVISVRLTTASYSPLCLVNPPWGFLAT